jgi:hypothetical protein
MADDQKTPVQPEIAHVLFIDIVGYSKLSIDQQQAAASLCVVARRMTTP